MTTLKERIEQMKLEISKYEKILKILPDIEITIDRWQQERFISKSILQIADQATIFHSCGCCDDSPLYVHPFLNVEGIEVFSDPNKFIIGKRNKYGYGDEPFLDWEENLKKAGVHKDIIKLCKEYFNENPPIDDYGDSYENDEDDD